MRVKNAMQVIQNMGMKMGLTSKVSTSSRPVNQSTVMDSRIIGLIVKVRWRKGTKSPSTKGGGKIVKRGQGVSSEPCGLGSSPLGRLGSVETRPNEDRLWIRGRDSTLPWIRG